MEKNKLILADIEEAMQEIVSHRDESDNPQHIHAYNIALDNLSVAMDMISSID